MRYVNFLLIGLIILIILMVGCVNDIYNSINFEEIINKNNPELCLNFNNEIVDETFAKNYISNIGKVDNDILFKDLCLIYSISVVEHPDENKVLKPNVNDDFIILCNEASDRIYRFFEEGYYDVTAWEFCFRKAFGAYKSFSQPPSLGDIKNKQTCEKLKEFKDECLWLVAMNNNDEAVCNLISNEARTKMCIERLKSQIIDKEEVKGTGIIKGTVKLSYGDCMPGVLPPPEERECETEQDCIDSGKCDVGIECTCFNSQCYVGLIAAPESGCNCVGGCPVSKKIVIREGDPNKVDFEIFKRGNKSQIINTTFSDEEGNFEISLPVGEYYVYAEHEEKEYCFINNVYCSTSTYKVKRNEIIEANIHINLASY